jgi:Tol biopolymer transport system component
MKYSAPAHLTPAFMLALATALSSPGCGDGGGITVPSSLGILEITTTTTGSEIDADGYSVRIDGGVTQGIAASATLRMIDVGSGTHTVLLAGLALNCTVSEANPQTVTVTPGDTAKVAFTVTCAPTTGSLVITSITSGASPDPDGYTILLDGVSRGSLGVNDVVTIIGLPPGTHVVELSGVSENCSIPAGTSLSVTVATDAPAEVRFGVVCISVGTLDIVIGTVGSSPDPDGYLVSLDGSTAQPIGANATLRLEALALGPHVLALSGLAPNCHLDGENPRTVEVVLGTTVVPFALTCLGADALIAFSSNGSDLEAIFTVRPDGSGLRNLTPRGEFERNPVWSPDGRKILFAREFDLYIMQADGGGRVLVAPGSAEGSGYNWSPDGRMIAFTHSDFVGDEFIQELWVMSADGTGQLRLAAEGSGPSWSPDSRRIAYESGGQIRVINVDGSGDARLTNQRFGAFQPAWSPLGDRIAFLTATDEPPDRPADRHIFLMNPDGSALEDLSRGRGDDERPTWSPDGSKIAFLFSEGGEGSEVGIMSPDGSGRTNLTRTPGFDFDPAWSPDGSRIVFSRSEDDGSEIYVMNSDGSSQVNISNRRNTEETAPNWGGQSSQTVAGRGSLAYDRWLKARSSSRRN